MPAPTPEKLGEKTQSLKKKLAESKDSMGSSDLRALQKRIRRLQRKRRRLVVSEQRRTAQAAKKKEE